MNNDYSNVYRVLAVTMVRNTLIDLYAIPYEPDTEPVEDPRLAKIRKDVEAKNLPSEIISIVLATIPSMPPQEDDRAHFFIRLTADQYRKIGSPTVGGFLNMRLAPETKVE